MYRQEIKVFDCTIRDGGLMNNHLFSDELVRKVYQAANDAHIDYIELGYKAKIINNILFQWIGHCNHKPFFLFTDRDYHGGGRNTGRDCIYNIFRYFEIMQMQELNI